MAPEEPPAIYALIAAVAGGISGLAFVRWKDMGWVDILLTIFVGITCAIFVAPWLTNFLFGVPTDAGRTAAFMTYVTGVGAHILLPPLIRFIGRAMGEKA